jgi:adenosylcobinamide-GDP ribazoletransferase
MKRKCIVDVVSCRPPPSTNLIKIVLIYFKANCTKLKVHSLTTKGLKGLLSFLTIIPVKMEKIEVTAEYFFLCPIVGLIIGLIAGAVGCVSNFFLPQIIAGFLVLSSIQLLTGFHHFDGLLDFSDAAMVRAETEKRLDVMHDKYTGAAAVSAGFIILALTGLSLGYFSGIEILRATIVSEIVAKESMVLTAYFGKAPPYKGMGYQIIESMKNKHSKCFFSLALSAVIVFLLIGASFIYVFVAMVFTVLILNNYAAKAFGCVTGDVLGTTNEINRMISLLILIAIVS